MLLCDSYRITNLTNNLIYYWLLQLVSEVWNNETEFTQECNKFEFIHILSLRDDELIAVGQASDRWIVFLSV